MVYTNKKREEMGVVTRAQSLHLVKLKISEFLKKHPLLRTRQRRLRNFVQLFDFLSSVEARAFVCHYAAFGQTVAEKLFELTSEGLCPNVAAHYFREIFEKRASQLKYPLTASVVQTRREKCMCMCEPGDPVVTTLCLA